MTWEELRSFLKASQECVFVRDETDRLAIDIGSQRLVLELAQAFDEPWLIAVSPIVAKEDVIRPIDALEMNGQYSLGAMAVVDDVLVFRWATSLAILDVDGLARALAFIGR